MAEDETKKDETTEETPQEETVEETPAPEAEETPAEQPAAEQEPNPEDDLPWKERRRLSESRRPHEAKPQRSVEERIAEREALRKRKAEERRKERAEAKKERTQGTGTPVAEKDSNAAKVRQGVVVSDKGQKSITVRVDIVRRHPDLREGDPPLADAARAR